MYQANFGRNNPSQIQFQNESEYYHALGYLTRNNNTTSFTLGNTMNYKEHGVVKDAYTFILTIHQFRELSA